MLGERVDAAPLSDADDRALIRNALDETIVVEAAAGTGKTTELVARIVRVLASRKAAVDEIVAVTFTEKAAGELKLRIREELERARSRPPRAQSADAHSAGQVTPADPTGADARDALEDALKHLEKAHVSTIHGFCAELLRERPVEAQVDPEFTVLTEAQADRLFDDAFRLWLQSQLQDPGEGVRRCLRRSDPHWQDEGEGDGPIGRLRGAARALREWRDFARPWRRDRFDRPPAIRDLMQRVREFASLTERPSWSGDNLYKGTAAARRLAAEFDRAAADGIDDPDGWEGGLIELASHREFREVRRRPGNSKQYSRESPRADVLAAYDALSDALASFQRAADADLAALLQRELRDCLDRYEEVKRRAGALDFLDLLLRARHLVANHAEVRRDFQNRFRCLFVDEFQDTDPLQAEILLLLAADEASSDPAVVAWRNVPIRRGALFIVGDPKQSIYRFRRADVGVYQEVCDLLVDRQGAVPAKLTTSFRSVPNIQRAVNAAFSPLMTRDPRTLQANYVPLAPFRPPLSLAAHEAVQPSVVVLPVPRPYGKRYVAGYAVEQSLPDAIGAFVDWLVHESGWRVMERRNGREELVAISPRHVCLLFRRFMSWRTDVTRGYVDALEARGVPHLLVGGRSFHEREEVETLRSALAAIEWPDDQLSVYATLRGGLFGVGEELLLAYWHQHPRRRFHPFDIPEIEAPTLEPVVTVLRCLRELHIRRNHRPVADTIAELLNVTRAHVGFVLRPAGEQALANVMHVAELARQYEMDGGISFRGFVEELRLAAERLESPEAPVLEEGSEGVRLMTVHKAKGLEFPVVVLADITCRLNRATAGRVLEAPSGLCAIRLAGCAPAELLEHQADEVARDEAEGVRLAYVAATRARDLLIVPAVGDQEVDGWVRPLNAAIYPATGARRRPQQAPGCPEFFKDTVLERPDGDPHGDWTVAPGLHEFVSSDVPLPLADSHLPVRDVADMYSVVWWDPKALMLDVQPPGGLRAADLIARAGSEQLDADALRSYWTWQGERGAALAAGSAPTMRVRTITEWAQSGDPWPSTTLMPHTEIVELPRAGTRPSGRRFGTLVHAVLATAALHTDRQTLLAVARVQGRLVGAADEEIAAAGDLASQVLEHPLLRRAREADHRGACRREVPVTLTASGTLMEGIVDLAFEEDGRWVVVDFKTDGDLGTALDAYRRQVSMYAAAFSQAMHRPVDAHILTI